jgi:hypothetical protein
MVEKVMSAGIQASSVRGVQASPSNSRGSRSFRPTSEKRTKHIDDLANAKLILTILPDYIPPLGGAVSCDSVPRDFDYTLVTVYLSKGIRVVREQKDKITTLKFNEFNLGDYKNHSMLTPYKYLTRTKGKNSKLIPQLWTMNLAQSTLLNVMKIPHFGRNQKVNACVNLLLSCYHGGYLWLYRHITIDLMLIHRIIGLSMQGPDPQDFYPGKGYRSRTGTENQRHIWKCRKGNVRLQGSFHLEWRSVPGLPTDRKKDFEKEPTYTGHRIRC